MILLELSIFVIVEILRAHLYQILLIRGRL
jgi:hypothetical protein